MSDCLHLYRRVRRGRLDWLRADTRERWVCVRPRCGLRTRRYDAADRAAMRPVHPWLSVALPGYNTLPTRGQR